MPGIESRDNKYINTISFYQKDFTGPMPDLSGLTKCGSLYLTSTKVSGPLPNLPPNLYNLGLSDNNLTGPLPSVWPAHLSTLNLRNNQIAGPFPNLPNTLTGVFLSNNMLSGSIPDSIPPFLNAFDVSNNKLDGFIPSSLSPRLNFNPVLDGNCFVNAATFKATNRKDCPADTPIVSASESPKVSATVTNGPIASTVSSVTQTPSQSCDPRLPSDPITNPCPIKKPSAEIANLASGPIPSSGALSIYNGDSVQLIAKLNIQLPATLGKVNASKLASSLFSITEPVTPGIPAKFAGAAIPSSNDTTPGLNAIVMLVTPSRYQAIKYENLQTYNEASSGTVSAEILPIGFSITYVFGNFIKSVWFTFDLHNDGTLIIAANTGNSVLASVQIDGNLFALRRDASATFALVLGVAPVDIPSSSVPTAVILPSSSLSTIQSAIAKDSAVTSASEFFTTTTIPVLPTGATMPLLTGTKAILTTAASMPSFIGTKETVTSAIYGTMLPSPSASTSSSSSGSAEPKITKTRSIDIKVGSSRRNCYLGLTLALLFVMI
ncbi:hypothetical protein HDU99_000852 [Rhizoclosmatium hyalinum]|nr:hypothetical protein HDU99_000852 [Rhizoclosmatium hyalinum]